MHLYRRGMDCSAFLPAPRRDPLDKNLRNLSTLGADRAIPVVDSANYIPIAFSTGLPSGIRAGPILHCARVFNADRWKKPVEGNAVPCGNAE